MLRPHPSHLYACRNEKPGGYIQAIKENIDHKIEQKESKKRLHEIFYFQKTTIHRTVAVLDFFFLCEL